MCGGRFPGFTDLLKKLKIHLIWKSVYFKSSKRFKYSLVLRIWWFFSDAIYNMWAMFLFIKLRLHMSWRYFFPNVITLNNFCVYNGSDKKYLIIGNFIIFIFNLIIYTNVFLIVVIEFVFMWMLLLLQCCTVICGQINMFSKYLSRCFHWQSRNHEHWNILFSKGIPFNATSQGVGSSGLKSQCQHNVRL